MTKAGGKKGRIGPKSKETKVDWCHANTVVHDWLDPEYKVKPPADNSCSVRVERIHPDTTEDDVRQEAVKYAGWTLYHISYSLMFTTVSQVWEGWERGIGTWDPWRNTICGYRYVRWHTGPHLCTLLRTSPISPPPTLLGSFAFLFYQWTPNPELRLRSLGCGKRTKVYERENYCGCACCLKIQEGGRTPSILLNLWTVIYALYCATVEM